MTTPRRPCLRRWTQYHDGDRTGPLVTGTPGTYQVRDDRVLAFVDTTTFTDTTHFEAITQAALDTRLTQVTLIGPSHETRRVGAALQGYWDATHAVPPKPVKPKALPAPPRAERARCGQPRVRDGQPCRQLAGHGADPGERHCAQHGGSTRQQEAAREHTNKQLNTLISLSRKAATGAPFTLRENLDGLVALRDVVVEIEDQRRRGKLR